jgi:hypothetical protein
MPHITHRKTSAIPNAEIKNIMTNPRLVARVAKAPSIPIVRKYDIPYLGGYSEDGSKVYIDRHLNCRYKGKDISKFIRIHEVAEKAALDIFNLTYQQAHKIANHIERQAVEKAGLDWIEYCNHLDPFIKQVSKEHIQLVPGDLDLTPYKDEKDKKLLASLKSKLNEEIGLQETKISLEYHNELNPKLWNGARLKPDVREALILFGNAWADFAKIPRSMIMDIIMTGGNANYNYTAKSDIDVHLVMDRYAFAPGVSKEFVDEYFQDKKVLWTLTHDINILGYSLEPYAQDNVDRYPANQGVYSLTRDRWIQFPNKGDYNFQDDPGLKRKVLFYKRMINKAIKDKMDMIAIKEIKNKIRNMRGAAIVKGGEFSFENLVFKELRNTGYLDKINKYEQLLKNKSLSL